MSSRDDAPTMALIVRKDLSLSTGKTAVQCAHAAVACTLAARKTQARLVERWSQSGSRKVCLQIEDLAGMRRLCGQAQSAGMVTHLVKDAGLTEVSPGEITVLGIGPAPRRSLDAICGDLKPY